MDPDDKMDVDAPENPISPPSEKEESTSDAAPTLDTQPPTIDQDAGAAPCSSASTADPHPHASFQSSRKPNGWERREIARTTIAIIDEGSFELDGQVYDLETTKEALIEGTVYYPPTSELEEWPKEPTDEADGTKAPKYNTEVAIVQCSTLEGCHNMHAALAASEGGGDKRIGVLNFASAKKPGGGFLTGAQAQEETIARSSTLYASLMIDTAQQFYDLHHGGPKDGFYTHAMIYSPHVHLLRYDSGDWHPPFEVEVVTSPAVNAGDVREKTRRENPDAVEAEIENVMKERMARVLYLFEKQGVRNLILGSFGTGVFRNSIELVAELWVELLVAEGARFKESFERVLFAIIDTPTVTKFRDVFSGKEESEDEGSVTSRGGKEGEAQVSPKGGDEESPSQVPPKGEEKEGRAQAPPKEEGQAQVSPTGGDEKGSAEVSPGMDEQAKAEVSPPGGDEQAKSQVSPIGRDEQAKAQVSPTGRDEKGKAPVSPRDGAGERERRETRETRTDGAEAGSQKRGPKL